MNEEILDEQELGNFNLRRRDLLPTWIKVFVWIFLIFGAVVPIALVLGVTGMSFDLSLYGLNSSQPFSLTGIIIIMLFAIKGVAAFGLWTEKKWAVNVAIIDAIIGVIVCITAMGILPFITDDRGIGISFRLELILLIPYFLKMKKIKTEWERRMV